MRSRHLLARLPLLLLLAGACVLLAVRRPMTSVRGPVQATVTIDGARMFQSMDGFGVNAIPKSWNGGELAPAIDRLIELGSTIWRVDVGDGHSNWESRNDDGDPFTFNWTYFTTVYESRPFQDLWAELAYLNQKGVTLELSASGLVPGWMGEGAIPPGMEDEFVEEMVSVVHYARNVKGIRFDMFSPLNETNFGPPEGPKVAEAQFARIMRKIALRLDAVGMADLQLVGPHTTSFDTTYTRALMDEPAVMAHTKVFAYHSYAGSGAEFSYDFIKGSAFADRRVWVGEWNQVTTDGGLDGGGTVVDEWAYAREMTAQLLNHIEGGASAALVWDAWDNWHEHQPCCPMSRWGLLAHDAVTGKYSPKKRAFTTAQVFRFVRPGMVRVAATTSLPGVRVYAFVDRGTGLVTLTGQNTTASAQTLTGTLTGLPPVTALAVYHTDARTDLARGSDVTVSGNSFSAQIPADSFFTLTSTMNELPPSPVPAPAPAPPSTPSAAPPAPPPAAPAASAPPSPAAAAPSLANTVLVGEQTVAPNRDSNPAGTAEAFGYTARAAGTVTTLAVYIDSGNAAGRVIVGLYSGTPSGEPGELLTHETITNPAKGEWNTVAVPAARVTAGTPYWIAVLAPDGAGAVAIRDQATGNKSQTSARTDLTTLPMSWTPGTGWPTAAMSAYAAP